MMLLKQKQEKEIFYQAVSFGFSATRVLVRIFRESGPGIPGKNNWPNIKFYILKMVNSDLEDVRKKNSLNNLKIILVSFFLFLSVWRF